MTTSLRAVTGRGATDNLEPLAVSPKQAAALLGLGLTRVWALIGSGELVTYREGRARRVTMASIRARVARLTGDAEAPTHRGRGRPRKAPTSAAQ